MRKKSAAGKTPADESIVSKELFTALADLERERGISQEYMLERVEAALLSAFRKENAGNENALVKLDPLGQEAHIYKIFNVVDTVLNE